MGTCEKCGTTINHNGRCPGKACTTRRLQQLFASVTRYVYDRPSASFVVMLELPVETK